MIDADTMAKAKVILANMLLTDEYCEEVAVEYGCGVKFQTGSHNGDKWFECGECGHVFMNYCIDDAHKTFEYINVVDGKIESRTERGWSGIGYMCPECFSAYYFEYPEEYIIAMCGFNCVKY